MTVIMTFLEGLASFLSPCTLPLVPVYVAYFAAEDRSKASTFARSLAFVLAFALVFVTLGAFAGSGGRLLSAHRTEVRVACGGLMAVLGLGYLGLFRLPLSGNRRSRPVTGLVSAFLFGLAFALGLTPCVGAFLAAALLQAAAEGTALKGTFLLAAYSVGLGVPFVLSAVLLAKFGAVFGFIKRNYNMINPICGAALVLFGAWMIGGQWLAKAGAASERRSGLPTASETNETSAAHSAEPAPTEVTITEANFEAEVLKAKGPVLVDFWAPWCGPCRRLAPLVEALAKEKAGVLKVCKANVDETQGLAAKYGISGIPTLILFRDGKPVSTSVGLIGKEELDNFVK